MANIVYGVAGEGSGHSSRARELATHLREQGHAVRLASYDRGYRNLKDDFDVCEIEGLTMVEISSAIEIPSGTVASRLRRARAAFREAVSSIKLAPSARREAGGRP